MIFARVWKMDTFVYNTGKTAAFQIEVLQLLDIVLVGETFL